MLKIVVFDSGLGSLSIVRALQKTLKSQIYYFADQKNFPYGKKSKQNLRKIIHQTIYCLNQKFKPDWIIVGSNTPTLLLKITNKSKIIGVLPPLKNAVKKTRTKTIAILATQSVVNSKELSFYVKKSKIPKDITIKKINISPLVEIVESGLFLTNKKKSKKIIKKILKNPFDKYDIDVATLSSTHLPFLLSLFKEEFPPVTFLDPSIDLAKGIKKNNRKISTRNSLEIYSSGDILQFQKLLIKLGIKNRVSFLSF